MVEIQTVQQGSLRMRGEGSSHLKVEMETDCFQAHTAVGCQGPAPVDPGNSKRGRRR